MNIVKKDIDQNNATLTLSIVKSDYAEKVEKTLRDYRKKANIPGFRPGMVPVGLIKKMYGKAIVAEDINKIISEELYAYIHEHKINMLGEPLPNETEQQPIDFDNSEDFEFIFDLGIAPEFEVELSKKDKVKAYSIAVNDEMINNQIVSYASRYGKYVQEETVAEKDMVKGEVLELIDGKINENGHKISDAVLTPSYIKDEALKVKFIGAAKGDVIVFNPQTAFENEAEISSLLKISKDQAKDITSDFQIKIEGITRYYDAEINQELFNKVYGEGVITTEEEFRTKIKEGILETLSSDSDYKFGQDAREMLIAKFDHLTFPDTFLKRWLLATNDNLTKETLEEDFPKMIADLKWQLIKDKLAKANDVKVEIEDVNAYARKIASTQFAQYGIVGMDDDILDNYAKEVLKKEETVKGIVERVAENKVFEIVKNSVKLDTKEVTIEEFNKMFEN